MGVVRFYDVLTKPCHTRTTHASATHRSPVSSGACEVYSNCFDVTIAGATGGLESTAAKFSAPISPCARVSPSTHYTTMFGPMITDGGSGGSGGGGNAGDGGGGNTGGGEATPPSNCMTHTVKSGDTLTKIAIEYDIADWKTIYDLNKK